MNTGTFNSKPGEPISMCLSGHTLADRQLTRPASPLELQRINLQVPTQL